MKALNSVKKIYSENSFYRTRFLLDLAVFVRSPWYAAIQLYCKQQPCNNSLVRIDWLERDKKVNLPRDLESLRSWSLLWKVLFFLFLSFLLQLQKTSRLKNVFFVQKRQFRLTLNHFLNKRILYKPGFESGAAGWEARALPLYYATFSRHYYATINF